MGKWAEIHDYIQLHHQVEPGLPNLKHVGLFESIWLWVYIMHVFDMLHFHTMAIEFPSLKYNTHVNSRYRSPSSVFI